MARTQPSFLGDQTVFIFPLTLSFWDFFEAVVDSNPTLTSVSKFNCLKAQLQADAARAIECLPLTEANYVVNFPPKRKVWTAAKS